MKKLFAYAALLVPVWLGQQSMAEEAPQAQAAAAAHAELIATGENSEVVCEMDVFYKWKKGESTDLKNQRTAPQATNELSKETKSFYRTITDHGRSETEAKKRLTGRGPSIEADALDYCRENKENLAACISLGLKNHGKAYNLLDFPARKALLNAISSDCEKNGGECLMATVEEPRCSLSQPLKAESIAAQATSEEKGKEQEQEKDKKKKK